MFPKRLGRRIIYESEWINLYVDKVLMPSGKIIEKYHQLDYQKESVVILLLNPPGEICFIKSLRYTTQKIEWELPAGNVEPSEDLLITAKREVMEETGYKTKSLKFLFSYHPSLGISNQNVHVVFGEIEANEPAEFDTDEVREVLWLSPDATKELIVKNEISDGITLLPLLLYFSEIMPM